jgi:hypothetical protein
MTLAASPSTVDANGGSGQVNITVDRDCTWDARADADWIRLTPPTSGQGEGTLRFTTTANTAVSSRRGAVVVNDQRVDVVQAAAACSFALSAPGAEAPAQGAALAVTVTAPTGCSWTATSPVEWIQVSQGRQGSGNGVVSIAVAANGGESREAAVLIGGQSYTVTQAAGSTSPTNPQPPQPGCQFNATPTAASYGSSGGEGGVTVAASSSSCVWAAASSVPWITMVTTAGNGNGTARYTVAANTGGERTGNLSVAGATIRVTQAAAPPAGCSYNVTPTTQSFAAAGGDGTIRIDASSSTCTWTAATSASWISLASGSGNGSADLRYTVAANTGPERSGTVSVAGATVTITQAAAPAPTCTFDASPRTPSVDNAGGDVTIHVTTSAPSCAWTATSGAPWVTVAVGAGTGGGDARFTVAANTGAARTATLTVAGIAVTVTQSAAPACTFMLSPTSQSVAAAGVDERVNVDASTNSCAWTAVSNAQWITITAGNSRTGDADVRYTVAANTGGARTGTMTIAGTMFTVTQAAAPPCTFTVNPTSQSFTDAAGTGTVSVNASAGSCAWTATTTASWITVTTGAGTGNGTARYSVAQNTGAARSSTLTVAGVGVAISQAAAPPPSIEVSGAVSGLSGNCPALTFTVGGRLVRTNSATDFQSRCDRIRNGDTVTVTGVVQSDNSLLASVVREG